MFGIAIGLVLSTDRLLAFLAGPRERGECPGRSPPATPVATSTWLTLVAAPAFVVVLVVQLALSINQPRGPGAVPPLAANADLLPEELAGWRRTDFAVQSRPSESYFGEQSHIWRYTHGGLTVLVSLDSTFPSWHDLTWCYVGTGWVIERQQLIDSAVPGGLVEARMGRPINRHGYLLFCEFDRRGRPLTARAGGTAASPFRHRLALARFGVGEPVAADPVAPVYQLQVFADGWAETGSDDDAAIRELMVAAQSAIREAWAAGR
jgi:hypothetical protein